MRQNKIENDAKKIVREKTEQTKRSDAWERNRKSRGIQGPVRGYVA